MKTREPEQLKFEFLNEMESKEKRRKLEIISGLSFAGMTGSLTFLGLTYLSKFQPEYFEGFKSILEAVYATYPGPY